jgi:hypothetical protein
MARTPITAIAVVGRGTTPAAPPAAQASDVANGNSLNNDGRVVLLVSNTAAASGTLTVAQQPGVIDGVATPGLVVTIPATTNNVPLGRFRPEVYGSVMNLNGSAATITVLALQETLN